MTSRVFGNRIELINYVIVTRGYESYLEIGCAKNETFDTVRVARKVGVDPVRGGTHRMTSDEFFAQCRESFDLVFVDGLHHEDQVLRDVHNALQIVSPAGCIVVHDCLPAREIHQLVPRQSAMWTGDVWKAVVALRTRPDLDIAVLDADWGCGVVFPRPNSDVLTSAPAVLDWRTFEQRGRELLRVVDQTGMLAFVAAA